MTDIILGRGRGEGEVLIMQGREVHYARDIGRGNVIVDNIVWHIVECTILYIYMVQRIRRRSEGEEREECMSMYFAFHVVCWLLYEIIRSAISALENMSKFLKMLNKRKHKAMHVSIYSKEEENKNWVPIYLKCINRTGNIAK